MESLLELSNEFNNNITVIKKELNNYLINNLPILLPMLEKTDINDYETVNEELSKILTLIESPLSPAYEIARKAKKIKELEKALNYDDIDLIINDSKHFIKKYERKETNLPRINKTASKTKEVIIPIKEKVTLAIDIGEIDAMQLGTYASDLWSLDEVIRNDEAKPTDLMDTECLPGFKHKLNDNTDSDELVCINCGLVIEKELVSQAKRAYNKDEINSRIHNELFYRDFGPATVIDKKDIPKLKVSSKQKSLWIALSKIQGSLVNSLERNYWEAKPMLNKLKEYINNDAVMIEAWKIYTEVAKQKLTMGRSIVNFIAASVYAAMKNNNVTIMQDKFLNAVKGLEHKITMHAITRAYHLIVEKCITSVKVPKLKDWLNKFGSDLNIHPVVINESLKYINYFINKEGHVLTGKTPDGITSAIFYHVLKKYDFDKVSNASEYYWPRTQTEIAKRIGTTEVTLRTRKKELDYFLKLEANKKRFKLSEKSFNTGVNNLKDYLKNKTINEKEKINPIVNTLTYLLINEVDKKHTEALNFLAVNNITQTALEDNLKKYFPKAYKRYYLKN